MLTGLAGENDRWIRTHPPTLDEIRCVIAALRCYWQRILSAAVSQIGIAS